MKTNQEGFNFAEGAKQSIEKTVQKDKATEKATQAIQGAFQKENYVSSINAFLQSESIQRRLKQLVGENAAHWTSTILQIVTSNDLLKKAEPKTIVSAAIQSIVLNLPLDKNLGFAYIVPYKDVAQFQIGYKGFIQLAIRTGQYKTMNVTTVYDGQLVDFNMLSGEIVLNKDAKKSDKVIGYFAYFRLLNGFEKSLFMTREQMEVHAKTYSQSYKKGYGLWIERFDDMGLKTVIKLLLMKWGILSIELQKAVKLDQSVITDIDGENIQYIDNMEEIS